MGRLFASLYLMGDYMKDIKVIFRGNRVPSGKSKNVPTMVGKARLDQYKNQGFEIEVLDSPKPKTKPKKKKVNKEKE